jgi:hypothetical protein
VDQIDEARGFIKSVDNLTSTVYPSARISTIKFITYRYLLICVCVDRSLLATRPLFSLHGFGHRLVVVGQVLEHAKKII